MIKIKLPIIFILCLLFFAAIVMADVGIFGNTNDTTNFEGLATNKAKAYLYTAPADVGYAISITAKISQAFGDDHIKGCIWDTGGTTLGCTGEIQASGVFSWKTGTFSVKLTPLAMYYIGFVADDLYGYAFDTDTSNPLSLGATDNANSYATPQNFNFDVTDKKKPALYVTYNTPVEGRLRINSGSLNIKSGTLWIK